MSSEGAASVVRTGTHDMWRAGHAATVGVVLLVVVVFVAPGAEAVPCGARCYGIASWDPALNRAGFLGGSRP